MVFTSSDGRPVAVAVLAPVSFAVDVGGCSTTTGISEVTPASPAPAAISAVTAAAAGGGGLYNNKSNA